VLHRVAPLTGTIAAVAFAMFPAMACAQVNIDQGKSAAEIFSSVCTACHKTPRGLAVGKNSLMLSAFLREHYTASRDQAAALAAYVLGAGGAEPAPKQKPEVEHARAEEPKTGESNPAAHSGRTSAKPDEEKPPKEQEAKREEHSPSPASTEKRKGTPETASREGKPQPEEVAPAAHEAAPLAAAPAANPTPSAAQPSSTAASPESLPTASAAAPAEEQPSAGATVPRDNIPD